MIRVFMLILRPVGAAAFLWLGLFGPLAGRGRRRGVCLGDVERGGPRGCLGKSAHPRNPAPPLSPAASWVREGGGGGKKTARNEARPTPSRSSIFLWFYFDADISGNSL